MTTTNDGRRLIIWTIYDHPKDWPEWIVARAWAVTPDGPVPARNLILNRDLEAMRQLMRDKGLTCLPRMEGDDPIILETWL